MKAKIKQDNIKEKNIRPQKLYGEFLKLAKNDCYKFFGNARLKRIACPACLNNKTSIAFNKYMFTYEVCNGCKTLFVNPRAQTSLFDKYYREGESIKSLAKLYKETNAERKKFVYENQISLIKNKINNLYKNNKPLSLIDIGAGYGTFCSEFARRCDRKLYTCAIEPSPTMAQACRGKGIPTINKPLELVGKSDIKTDYKKIFTCFELVAHLADPGGFFLSLNKIMDKKEIFIFTMINGLGFDIQLLWECSQSVHPPHHLNFFNPRSIKFVLKRYGFRELEVTTPGRLDIDIVLNCFDGVKEKRFWSYFFNGLGKAGRGELQRLIREKNLSSHMVVVAQKFKNI